MTNDQRLEAIARAADPAAWEEGVDGDHPDHIRRCNARRDQSLHTADRIIASDPYTARVPELEAEVERLRGVVDDLVVTKVKQEAEITRLTGLLADIPDILADVVWALRETMQNRGDDSYDDRIVAGEALLLRLREVR